jgi:hypothetical protein
MGENLPLPAAVFNEIISADQIRPKRRNIARQRSRTSEFISKSDTVARPTADIPVIDKSFQMKLCSQ